MKLRDEDRVRFRVGGGGGDRLRCRQRFGGRSDRSQRERRQRRAGADASPSGRPDGRFRRRQCLRLLLRLPNGYRNRTGQLIGS